MVGLIYKYTSPKGKSYIGQTRQSLEKRADWSGKGYRESTYFFNAINKYGFKNFKVEVLHTVEAENAIELCEKLDALEIASIKLYSTRYPNGYNIDVGGKSRVLSEEQKENIRQKLTGVKHSEERRKNESLARMGKSPSNKGLTNWHTPEYLANQSIIGKRSTHTRWHINRGIINSDCELCLYKII